MFDTPALFHLLEAQEEDVRVFHRRLRKHFIVSLEASYTFVVEYSFSVLGV